MLVESWRSSVESVCRSVAGSRMFTGLGVFWRYMVILGHFGAKPRRKS